MPYAGPRQLPLQDQFLDGIRSVQAPDLRLENVNSLPPQRVVQVEDLLTKITSVPQRQNQMTQSQRFQNNQMQFRPSQNRQSNKSHMEQSISKPIVNSPNTQPYWLSLDYLTSILQQNQQKIDQRPTTIVIAGSAQPSQVSTSCGPRGCTATSGSSTSNGFVQQQATRPPNRPSRPSIRPTRPPSRPTRPPNNPPNNGPSSNGNDRPPVDLTEDTSSGSLMNSNNNGRMLPIENSVRFLQKRAPAEATSLQSLLSHHKIDTNVLKTRAQIAQPQPRPLSSQILTPTTGSDYYRRPVVHSGIRTENQRPLPENFYTNSDIFPQFSTQKQDQLAAKQVIEKQDLGPARPKTSFRETAIIALKLSQSILNLYKTVSPYFT